MRKFITLFISGAMLFCVAFATLPLTLLLFGAPISQVFECVNYGIAGALICALPLGFILDKIKN